MEEERADIEPIRQVHVPRVESIGVQVDPPPREIGTQMTPPGSVGEARPQR